MIGFIQNNPLLVLGLALIVAFTLVLGIIQASGNTKTKKQKKVQEPTASQEPVAEPDKKGETDKKEEPEKKPEEETKKKKETETETEVVEKKEKKEKEEKKKKKEPTEEPKVEPVFKPEKKEEKPEEKKADDNKDEEALLGAMAFVKTSKTISKLARRDWIETPPESEFTTEELIAIDDIIREKEIADASTKTKHFDKSIRLSNYSQGDDYDSMFVSHISDKRTHINEHTHLNINTNFMERLYDRTNRALERSGMNSQSNVKPYTPFDDEEIGDLSDQLNDQREEFAYMIDESYKDSPLSQLPEGEYMDDTLNLGSENILVTDTVLHRKNRNRR